MANIHSQAVQVCRTAKDDLKRNINALGGEAKTYVSLFFQIANPRPVKPQFSGFPTFNQRVQDNVTLGQRYRTKLVLTKRYRTKKL